MRVVVRAKADADLDSIFDWISKDSRRAAAEMIRHIRTRVRRLGEREFTYTGRPGLDPGTRELVVYPYIVVYEVHEDRGEIVVLAIVHGARDREEH
jgi:toxin ParE1/3/4